MILTKLNKPTLPINIVKTMIILPPNDRYGVIPKDNPTVAKALNVSNNNSLNPLSNSNKDKRKLMRKIAVTAKDTKVKAFDIVSFLILLLKALASFPVINDLIAANITNTVVVLIPPPVEQGEAPININIMMIAIVPFGSRFKSNGLNPAVLDDTDKNKELRRPRSVLSDVR